LYGITQSSFQEARMGMRDSPLIDMNSIASLSFHSIQKEISDASCEVIAPFAQHLCSTKASIDRDILHSTHIGYHKFIYKHDTGGIYATRGRCHAACHNVTEKNAKQFHAHGAGQLIPTSHAVHLQWVVARRAAELLNQAQARVWGVALNRVKTRSGYYYGGSHDQSEQRMTTSAEEIRAAASFAPESQNGVARQRPGYVEEPKVGD
jgi:hypothetical protein